MAYRARGLGWKAYSGPLAVGDRDHRDLRHEKGSNRRAGSLVTKIKVGRAASEQQVNIYWHYWSVNTGMAVNKYQHPHLIESLPQETVRLNYIRAFVRYFYLGFWLTSKAFSLAMPVLPLIRELGLEEGLLDGESLKNLATHRALVEAWCKVVIGDRGAGQQVTEVNVIGILVASAALFGGLPTRRLWSSLLGALARPIETDGNIICLICSSLGGISAGLPTQSLNVSFGVA